MSTRNLVAIFTCLTASLLAASTSDAAWGDWLFGRTTSPYVAGYTPYAAGYVPVTTGYAPVTTGNAPYAAGYAPVVHSQMPAPATAAAPVPTLGTYQAQMQTYDNPSVYSGRPVIMAPGAPQTAYRLPAGGTTAPIGGMNSAYRPFLGQSAPVPTLPPALAPTIAPTIAPTTMAPSAVAPTTFAAPVTGIGNGLTFAPARSGGEVPLGRVLRRANTSSNPFYGTGNIYPSNFGAVAPTAAPYQAAYPTTTTTLPTAAPLTATAMAPSVSPLFPNAPRPRLGGLARFFGSRLGTRYQTAYYQAPITYYRPVTSIDPVTGTTVTVQQGCSSYVQQLQRTPYNTFQGQVFNGAAMGGAQCNSGSCPNVTAFPTQTAPSTYGPATTYGSAGQYPAGQYPTGEAISPMATGSSAIGQVGGIASPSDRNVIPIPSTEPSAGYYQQPNTAPLTGRPPGTGDLEAVEQPRLESARPPADEDYYRDGLFRRDVTPFANEEQESVEPSSFLQERVYKHSMPELNSPPIIHTPRQTQTEPQLPDPKLSPAELFAADPMKPSDTAYSDVRPIRAPESFKAPFPPRQFNAGDLRAADAADRSPNLFAPELPATQRSNSNVQRDNFHRRIDMRDANSASVRVAVPIREATMARSATRKIEPLNKPVRDSGGWLPMTAR